MRRLTLPRFFALATLAVALVVTVALAALVRRARSAALADANARQAQAALRIEGAVADELARARRAILDVERAMVAGAVPTETPSALEAPLLSRALADEQLEELTFTHAELDGYDDDGAARLSDGGRFQVAVVRDGAGQLTTRVVERAAGGAFVAHERRHSPGLGAPRAVDALPEPSAAASAPAPAPAALTAAGPAEDPTDDLTFSVIAQRALRGEVVWTDLHFSERDRHLPEAERRVVLTAQKAVFDAAGRFAGVLRCGLHTKALDEVGAMRVDPSSPDPQRVAVVARTGAGRLELVTRTAPGDPILLVDDNLRVAPRKAPPELIALLASGLAARIDDGERRVSGTVRAAGVPWRATISRLPAAVGGIDDWAVAVVIVEEHYTRAVAEAQRELLVALAATFAVLIAVGGLALAVVRRDLAKIITATTRMRAFDFSPRADRSPFADVDSAMAGLERAKTVVRAMGRYLPIDLVRRLYADNTEPSLGGEPTDVSILFTDIEGFTALAEKLPVAELARRLGDYLEAMTGAIEASGGTIDKYIGDAIMALWNAPAPVPGHAQAACRAILACQRAASELFAKPGWAELPPLVTRFGLHRSRVLVGHFGSPTRLSYTALGDGVNLAARLEPLCKQYGVHVLVTEDIVAEAPELAFRRIDRVAVKGKSRGVDIYELRGERGSPDPRAEAVAAYEAAFAAYLARDFSGAAALLAPALGRDPPSAVLHARCVTLAAAPPPAGWDGVHSAQHK